MRLGDLVNSAHERCHSHGNVTIAGESKGPVKGRSNDVLQAILKIIQAGLGKGRGYNISQDETLSIDDFLSLLAEIAGYKLHLKRIDQAVLENLQLLPGCSPFSDPWMSELDNQRSKLELGMQYTPLPVYLRNLIT